MNEVSILKQVVKEIRYFYELDTNKELLAALGYGSATYLSDIYGGRTKVSENLKARLKEKFHVNPEIFSTSEGEIFDDECCYSATLKIDDDGEPKASHRSIVNSPGAIAGNVGHDAITHINDSNNPDKGISDSTVKALLNEIAEQRELITKLVNHIIQSDSKKEGM